MNPYQYCSSCGSELDEWLIAKYETEHHGGPVLCQSCIQEVAEMLTGGIVKAVNAMGRALNTAFRGAFEPANPVDVMRENGGRNY